MNTNGGIAAILIDDDDRGYEQSKGRGELTIDGEASRSIRAAHTLAFVLSSLFFLPELRSRPICSIGMRHRYRNDDDPRDAGEASSSSSLDSDDLAELEQVMRILLVWFF